MSRICAVKLLRLLVSVWVMVLTASAQEIDASNMLTNIGAFDEAVLDGSTLTFNVIHPVPRESLDTESIVAEGEITRIGDAWLMRRHISDEVEPPEYSATKANSEKVSTDELDTYYVPRTIDLSILSDAEQVSAIETVRLYKVTPAGVDVVAPEVLNVELAERWSPLQDPMLYSLVFCAGRGYSYYVDAITSVHKLESGLYTCTGSGSYPAPNSSLSCTWKLTVDPEAAYIVREAEATRSDGSIIAHFRNEGLRWYAKGPLPAVGTFAFAQNRGYYDWDGLVRITFLSLLGEANTPAMVDALTLFANPFPDGTNVTDRRGEKPVLYRTRQGATKNAALGSGEVAMRYEPRR